MLEQAQSFSSFYAQILKLDQISKVLIHIAEPDQADVFVTQPYARHLTRQKCLEIHAHNLESMQSQTGIVFDELGWTQSNYKCDLTDFAMRQTIAHHYAYQQILRNPEIADEEFVLFMEDDFFLNKNWIKQVTELIHALSFEDLSASNIDLNEINFISLANHNLDSFQRYTHEELVGKGVQYNTYINIYNSGQLLRTDTINTPHLGCYLVRKRALRKEIANEWVVCHPAFDISHAIAFRPREFAYYNPVVAISSQNQQQFGTNCNNLSLQILAVCQLLWQGAITGEKNELPPELRLLFSIPGVSEHLRELIAPAQLNSRARELWQQLQAQRAQAEAAAQEQSQSVKGKGKGKKSSTTSKAASKAKATKSTKASQAAQAQNEATPAPAQAQTAEEFALAQGARTPSEPTEAELEQVISNEIARLQKLLTSNSAFDRKELLQEWSKSTYKNSQRSELAQYMQQWFTNLTAEAAQQLVDQARSHVHESVIQLAEWRPENFASVIYAESPFLESLKERSLYQSISCAKTNFAFQYEYKFTHMDMGMGYLRLTHLYPPHVAFFVRKECLTDNSHKSRLLNFQHNLYDASEDPRDNRNFTYRHDHLMKKFVVYPEQFPHNLAHFYSANSSCLDFTPIMAPSFRKLEQEQRLRLFPNSRFHKYTHTATQEDLENTMAYMEIFKRVLDDDSIADNDFVIIAHAHAQVMPAWRERVNYLVDYVSYINTSTKLIYLGLENYKNYVSYTFDDFKNVGIISNESNSAHFNAKVAQEDVTSYIAQQYNQAKERGTLTALEQTRYQQVNPADWRVSFLTSYRAVQPLMFMITKSAIAEKFGPALMHGEPLIGWWSYEMLIYLFNFEALTTGLIQPFWAQSSPHKDEFEAMQSLSYDLVQEQHLACASFTCPQDQYASYQNILSKQSLNARNFSFKHDESGFADEVIRVEHSLSYNSPYRDHFLKNINKHDYEEDELDDADELDAAMKLEPHTRDPQQQRYEETVLTELEALVAVSKDNPQTSDDSKPAQPRTSKSNCARKKQDDVTTKKPSKSKSDSKSKSNSKSKSTTKTKTDSKSKSTTKTKTKSSTSTKKTSRASAQIDPLASILFDPALSRDVEVADEAEAQMLIKELMSTFGALGAVVDDNHIMLPSHAHPGAWDDDYDDWDDGYDDWDDDYDFEADYEYMDDDVDRELTAWMEYSPAGRKRMEKLYADPSYPYAHPHCTNENIYASARRTKFAFCAPDEVVEDNLINNISTNRVFEEQELENWYSKLQGKSIPTTQHYGKDPFLPVLKPHEMNHHPQVFQLRSWQTSQLDEAMPLYQSFHGTPYLARNCPEYLHYRHLFPNQEFTHLDVAKWVQLLPPTAEKFNGDQMYQLLMHTWSKAQDYCQERELLQLWLPSPQPNVEQKHESARAFTGQTNTATDTMSSNPYQAGTEANFLRATKANVPHIPQEVQDKMPPVRSSLARSICPFFTDYDQLAPYRDSHPGMSTPLRNSTLAPQQRVGRNGRLQNQQYAALDRNARRHQRGECAVSNNGFNVVDYLATTPKFVINMLSNRERYEHFFSQPNTAGFTHFPAITGKDLSKTQREKLFDLEGFKAREGRYPTMGEIGCTLSHLQIYRSIMSDPSIHDDAWVLIAEDDVVLDKEWYYKVNKLLHGLQFHSHLDILLLSQVYIKHTDTQSQDAFLKSNYIYSKPHYYHQIGSPKDQFLQALNLEAYRYIGHSTVDLPVGFGTLSYYKPCASSFYLIRKRALLHNRQLLNAKPFWYADSFQWIIKDTYFDNMAFSNPILAVQSASLESAIESERLAFEQAKRAELRKIDIEAASDYLSVSNVYIVRLAGLSDAQILEKFSNAKIIEKVDYVGLSTEEQCKLFDKEAYAQRYGSCDLSDQEIERQLSYFKAFNAIVNNGMHSLQSNLVLPDAVILTENFSKNFNFAMQYINTRMSLNTNCHILGVRYLDQFADRRTPYTREELQELFHYDFAPEDELRINGTFNYMHVKERKMFGAHSFNFIKFGLKGDVVGNYPISVDLNDPASYMHLHNESVVFHNPPSCFLPTVPVESADATAEQET